MKKVFLAVLLGMACYSGFGQRTFLCKSYNYLPALDSKLDGIWRHDAEATNGIDTVSFKIDSSYFENIGYPDNNDLKVPDFEVQMKAVWYKDSVFFLFRRLDDELVNTVNDPEVAAGLENKDATAIYFFLSTDSTRLNGDFDGDTNNSSVAWLRFVWQSNEVEGMLTDGSKVSSAQDFKSQIVQWKDEYYYYAKIGIDLIALNPSLGALETKTIGFEIENDENDKEILENGQYKIQTRSFYGNIKDSIALNSISKWSWIKFFADPNSYLVSVKNSKIDFAKIYPNPASSELNIKLSKYDRVDYKLYDISGRALRENMFEGSKTSIDINDITTGVYFLQVVNSQQQTMTQKILITK